MWVIEVVNIEREVSETLEYKLFFESKSMALEFKHEFNKIMEENPARHLWAYSPFKYEHNKV